MKINIICVGKIKEKFYRDALQEYIKRLSRYTKLNILEVADEALPEGASSALEEQVKHKEGERILKQLPSDSYVIALDQRGSKLDSIAFSRLIEGLMGKGKSSISFIIGGSVGLTREVINKADEILSFSDMTFPHQLMRVILAEQVYRAFRIMKGEPYHK